MSYEELLIKCDTKNIGFFLIRYNPYQFVTQNFCTEICEDLFQIEVSHSYPYFYYLIKIESINRLIQTPKYFAESHYEFGKETDMVALCCWVNDQTSVKCCEPFTMIDNKNLQFIKHHIKKWTNDKRWIELIKKAHG